MSPTFYSILHVSSLLALFGGTFFAFAGAPETRRRTLIFTGVASLLMLVSGVGLLHKLGYGFPGWAMVKLVCWLGLSSLAGIGYRRRGCPCALKLIALVLGVTAVVMVYTKPF
ncbi:MAG: hypothetical protein JF599_01440 [Verrucomicrobia bacterium]|nr:hypothetical protein [Verrucomicrobiota bacterium]